MRPGQGVVGGCCRSSKATATDLHFSSKGRTRRLPPEHLPGKPCPSSDMVQPPWLDAEESQRVTTLLYILDTLQQFGKILDVRAPPLPESAALLAPGGEGKGGTGVECCAEDVQCHPLHSWHRASHVQTFLVANTERSHCMHACAMTFPAFHSDEPPNTQSPGWSGPQEISAGCNSSCTPHSLLAGVYHSMLKVWML